MPINAISPCITTDKIDETRMFYTKYLGADIVFDCGWYLSLQFGKKTSQLQFMTPQDPSQPMCNTGGLTYNFAVADVDSEYMRLTGAGLRALMPLEDHPWGDRGFAVRDPNGIVLYLYKEIEPTDEFKQFFVQKSYSKPVTE